MLRRSGELTTRGRPRQQIKPARVKVDRERMNRARKAKKQNKNNKDWTVCNSFIVSIFSVHSRFLRIDIVMWFSFSARYKRLLDRSADRILVDHQRAPHHWEQLEETLRAEADMDEIDWE